MTTIDLKIIELDNKGNVFFTLRNLGGRAIGIDKLTQKYCRFIYGSDCGALLQLFRTNKLSPTTIEYFSNAIVAAVSNTNEKILNIQKDLNLHSDEKFVDCRIRTLDIKPRQGIINLGLELITETGNINLAL